MDLRAPRVSWNLAPEEARSGSLNDAHFESHFSHLSSYTVFPV